MYPPTLRRAARVSWLLTAALAGLGAGLDFQSASAQTSPSPAANLTTTPSTPASGATPATPAATASTTSVATAAPPGSGGTGGRGFGGRGGPPQPLPAVLTPAMVAPGRGVRTGLHLTDFGAHDPWIYADADNKTYYLYVSGRGYGRTGTAFYKSKDLLSWDGPYLAFLVPDGTWANPQTSAWAPEVHFYKGKYYLFTTLHNPDKIISPGLMGGHPRNMRSTIIAVSDSPEGPFRMLKADAPTAPADFMTLDGTFFVDPDGHPWMVYAHEWVQKVDGTIEALPLKDDLSDASGPPIYLFKASDAPWIDQMATPTADENHYVSDGPEMWRTKDGHLLMLWSSYQRVDPDHDVYVETLARSTTGKLQGPWEQLPVLVGNDSGHGMLFHTFDGRLLLVVLQPFNGAHAKIYEVDDSGDHLVLGKYREDLSGPPLGPQSGQPVQ